MTDVPPNKVKEFQDLTRRTHIAMNRLEKAHGFENAVRDAHEALRGKVIKEVVGVENKSGKTVKVVCEDGMEFVAESVSGPGIHYEWDNRTTVSVKVHGATLGTKLIDE